MNGCTWSVTVFRYVVPKEHPLKKSMLFTLPVSGFNVRAALKITSTEYPHKYSKAGFVCVSVCVCLFVSSLTQEQVTCTPVASALPPHKEEVHLPHCDHDEATSHTSQAVFWEYEICFLLALVVNQLLKKQPYAHKSRSEMIKTTLINQLS